jgi:hypothetical protein
MICKVNPRSSQEADDLLTIKVNLEFGVNKEFLKFILISFKQVFFESLLKWLPHMIYMLITLKYLRMPHIM